MSVLSSLALATAISLNGTWDFRFEEDLACPDVKSANFAATDKMTVPGCFDAMPKWFMKRGTGLYRRTFVLDRAAEAAALVVDGLGLYGRFWLDGREFGTDDLPWSRVSLPVGPISAGEHVLVAAVDNRFDWRYQKLVRPYYDFHCWGGFFRGVLLEFDARKLFVRTRDYKTGEVEVEAVDFAERDFEAVLVFDGTNEVRTAFRDGRATVRVPGFKLWSPEHPNLHTVFVRSSSSTRTCAPQARFGIRTVEARNRGIYLNGERIFLKGVNRHEQQLQLGASTPEGYMLIDLQNLKAMGGNFIRGAHYPQSQLFLDLCDEMGVLVWEESLGWGNGQDYTRRDGINELEDPDFIEKQVRQTQLMVRNSFNHPSVIIFAFLNEQNSGLAPAKTLTDTLVRTIKAEDSGRLVTFACNKIDEDICHENTDLVAFNTYPGTINGVPGSTEELRKKVFDMKTYGINSAAMTFRARYPDKPIIISEIGVGAEEGADDPSAPFRSEDFQIEYLNLAAEAAYASPDIAGLTFWQYHDTRTCGRDCGKDSRKPHAMSCAGLFTWWRRPKRVIKVLADWFGNRIPASLVVARASVRMNAAGDCRLPEKAFVVTDVPGYNSWPMIQAMGKKLVCSYSRDNARPKDGHRIDPGRRDSYVKVSEDGGRTWSDEVTVAADPLVGEVNEGIGLDASGAALLWVRCWGKDPRHELYRTADGKTLEKIASLRPDPFPMQVMDPVSVEGLGLVSPWFAGSYRKDGSNSWGLLVSADGGRTWTQRVIESGLSVKDWVTEPSLADLGDGRLLIVGRCEQNLGNQFQVTSTDNGRTWRKSRTNIGDVRESTPSLVYDRATGLVANYYYHRGARQLKRRIASADFIFDRPDAWPEPEVLDRGFETRPHDAGNVKVTRFGATDCCAWYSGTPSNSTVVVTVVSKP